MPATLALSEWLSFRRVSPRLAKIAGVRLGATDLHVKVDGIWRWPRVSRKFYAEPAASVDGSDPTVQTKEEKNG